MHWQVQDAKNRFSKVLDLASSDGPQVVTRHGKPVAVVMSVSEYERVTGRQAKPDFKEWLLSGPKGDLPIERSRSPGRDVEF